MASVLLNVGLLGPAEGQDAALLLALTAAAICCLRGKCRQPAGVRSAAVFWETLRGLNDIV